MKNLALIILGFAALCSTQLAVAADAPADQTEKIAALIKQLGDPDWNKRVEATNQLKHIGKPALPQLEQAAKNKDDEIAARARFLIRHINAAPEVQPPAAGAPGASGDGLNQMLQQMMGGMGAAQGGNPMQLLQQLMGGMAGQGAPVGNLGQLLGGMGQPQRAPARPAATLPPDTTISEGDKQIRITHKIVLEITETIDGKPVKRTIEAGSLKELEEKDPSLAQTYKRSLLRPAAPAAGALPAQPNLGAMLNNPQLMQMLQQMLGGRAHGAPAQGQAQGQEQHGGLGALLNNPQLQQMIQQLMGGAPPPAPPQPPPVPQSPRASVDLTESFGAKLEEAADGLRVAGLKPDSPAAKNGLMVGDIILKVNGRELSKVADAQELLGKPHQGKGLKLDVLRRGEPFSTTIQP